MGNWVIGIEDVPPLAGVDVDSAKAWLKGLSALGLDGWHADDPVGDLVAPDGRAWFSPKAAEFVGEAVSRLHEASRRWDDPDFLYDLVGEGGVFRVEEDYPGFVVDACIAGAGRTGYVSVPGQKEPAVVVEEEGEFVLLEFGHGGRVSTVWHGLAVPLEGCRFDPEGGRGRWIDVSEMRRRDDLAVEYIGFDGMGAAVDEAASRTRVLQDMVVRP